MFGLFSGHADTDDSNNNSQRSGYDPHDLNDTIMEKDEEIRDLNAMVQALRKVVDEGNADEFQCCLREKNKVLEEQFYKIEELKTQNAIMAEHLDRLQAANHSAAVQPVVPETQDVEVFVEEALLSDTASQQESTLDATLLSDKVQELQTELAITKGRLMYTEEMMEANAAAHSEQVINALHVEVERLTEALAQERQTSELLQQQRNEARSMAQCIQQQLLTLRATSVSLPKVSNDSPSNSSVGEAQIAQG